MSKQVRAVEYGGLIPCRIAALGPAIEPDSRMPRLERAAYRLVVWLSELGTGPGRWRAARSPRAGASGIS